MKFVAITLSIILVILGAYASRKYQIETMQGEVQEVLSSEDEVEGVGPSPSRSVSSEPTETLTPTPIATQLPNTQITNFIYPQVAIKTQTDTELSLESSDDTDKITDWYKDKIVNLGMNVKSFVKTKANDKVLNKLSAADGKREINVSISKDAGTPLVTVSVILKNF